MTEQKIHHHAQLNHPACGCPEGASVVNGVVLTFWAHRTDCQRYGLTISDATYGAGNEGDRGMTEQIKPAMGVGPGGDWQLEAEEAGRKLASRQKIKPATDEEIQRARGEFAETHATAMGTYWSDFVDTLFTRIDVDRENMSALREAHDHAQAGLRNARKQETEMREKIAALEAEAIKAAERIEEYRAELRERDDRLSDRAKKGIA